MTNNIKTFTSDKKLPTITIGIPAFNEEDNIQKLLTSLLNQDQPNFIIQKIVVASDGSTDATAAYAREKVDPRITVKNYTKRKGQAYRQNQIFFHANTDLAVLLNADVIPVDQLFLYHLISPLINKEADLTSARIIPLRSDSVIGNLCQWSAEWKQRLYHQLDQGDTIFLCNGIARAFSKEAYTTIRWPQITSEDAYSYLAVKLLGMKFIYTPKAQVYYQPPDNIADHINQSVRYFDSIDNLSTQLDHKLIKGYYNIPLSKMIKISVQAFLSNPIKSMAYGLVVSYSKIISTITRGRSRVLWKHVASTKKLNIAGLPK